MINSLSQPAPAAQGVGLQERALAAYRAAEAARIETERQRAEDARRDPLERLRELVESELGEEVLPFANPFPLDDLLLGLQGGELTLFERCDSCPTPFVAEVLGGQRESALVLLGRYLGSRLPGSMVCPACDEDLNDMGALFLEECRG